MEIKCTKTEKEDLINAIKCSELCPFFNKDINCEDDKDNNICEKCLNINIRLMRFK